MSLKNLLKKGFLSGSGLITLGVVVLVSCSTSNTSSNSTGPVNNNNNNNNVEQSKNVVVHSSYKLVGERYDKDLDATLLVYEHKNGGTVVIEKNKSESMFSSVAFPANATDDTGVNHIIEHMIGSGTPKYPVKGLLTEARNRTEDFSAYTVENRIMYLTETKGAENLKNILDIYLNSLREPLFLTEENIFKLEGWRYELDSPESDLKVNGVVLNEMKFINNKDHSSALRNSIGRTLFEGTSSSFNIGGKEEDILTLTYERAKEVFRQEYNPSKAAIYIYGNVNVEEFLDFIDKEYFSHGTKVEKRDKVELKELTERAYVNAPYNVTSEESVENGYNFALSYRTISRTDMANYDILYCMVSLMNDLSSTIQKSFAESGLGSSLDISINDQINEVSVVTFLVTGADKNKAKEIEEFLDREIKRFREEGLAKELFDSVYDKINFYSQVNKNIIISDSTAITNIFDGVDIFEFLNSPYKVEEDFKNGKFQEIMDKYFINNNNSVFISLIPELNLALKKEEKIHNKLQEYKNSLSKEEVDKLVEDTKKYNEYASREATKEELDILPKIVVPNYTELLVPAVSTVNGVEYNYINNAQKPSQIVISFDASVIPQDKLLYMKMLTDMLNENLSTNTIDRADLELKKGASISARTLINHKIYPNNYLNPTGYNNRVELEFSTVNDRIGQALDLINSMINDINFNDVQGMKASLNQCIQYIGGEIYSYKRHLMEYNLLETGSEYLNYLNLHDYSNFLNEQVKKLESNPTEVVEELRNVAKMLFNKNNLRISFIGNDESYKNFTENIDSKLINNLNSQVYEPQTYDLETYKNKKVAFKGQTDAVHYSVGLPITHESMAKKGSMYIVKDILSTYIGNEIRTKIGAYGFSVEIINDSMTIGIGDSYNINAGLEAINAIPEYLRNLEIDNETLENMKNTVLMKQIITRRNQLLSKSMEYKLKGLTPEDHKEFIEGIKNTTVEDIKKFADKIEEGLKNGVLLVDGIAKYIDESGIKFDIVK